MEKIKVLFIQEKRIKNKKKVVTLGDIIEKEVPDTYEIDYASIKDNVMGRIKEFSPQILLIAQSKAIDVLGLVKEVKESFPSVVILVNLSVAADSGQEMMRKLKAAGVYKCYSSILSVDSLIHDMFVSLNME